MNRRQSTFKIKTLLPQIKRVEVKKAAKYVEEWLFEETIFPEIEGLDFN